MASFERSIFSLQTLRKKCLLVSLDNPLNSGNFDGFHLWTVGERQLKLKAKNQTLKTSYIISNESALKLGLGYLCSHLDQSDITIPMSDHNFLFTQQIRDYRLWQKTHALVKSRLLKRGGNRRTRMKTWE